MSKVVENIPDDYEDDGAEEQNDARTISANIIIEKTDFGWDLPEDDDKAREEESKLEKRSSTSEMEMKKQKSLVMDRKTSQIRESPGGSEQKGRQKNKKWRF